MTKRPTAGGAPIRALGLATLIAAAVAGRGIAADPPAREREAAPRRLEGPPLLAESAAAEAGEVARAGTEGPAPEVVNAPTLRADAGDDQVGLVGRQITLSGARSRGKGKVGFRWFQVGGPRAVAAVQDRHFLTFTPPAAGVYRFGLVVAVGSEIAEVDTVDVLVGVLPATPTPTAAASSAPALPAFAAAPAAAPAPAPTPPPIEDFAHATVIGLDGGPEAAAPLASTFEALAGRIDLYRTYSDLFSEMSRRLEIFVPQDPARRAAWVQQLFTPLTARLVDQLRAEGLDLTRADGPATPLTPAQKSRLADLFLALARGFRAASPPR